MSSEEKDALKEEIKNDLTKGYIKMSFNKLFALISCTVTICLSIFGAANWVIVSISEIKQKQEVQVDVNRDLKNGQDKLWGGIANLQTQINNNRK